MTAPRWWSLLGSERELFHVTVAFLAGRLREQKTLDWALSLDFRKKVERAATLEALDRHDKELQDPWKTAWRTVEESWQSPTPLHDFDHSTYTIGQRIRQGERSGSLISLIVGAVQPVIEVKPLSNRAQANNKIRSRPRSLHDLLSANLSSGKVVDPVEIGLDTVQDQHFLIELAHQLEAEVFRGLDMGRRLGRSNEISLWRLGMLHRVYFLPQNERIDEEHEPDEFHRGIAPSVKLLYAVVELISKENPAQGKSFIRRWQEIETPVHKRLWAALARDRHLAVGTEVSKFLAACDNKEFWNINTYPEIAELRALRFDDLPAVDQRAVLLRLRKGPPRNFWPRDTDKDQVEEWRNFWIARELRRIELGRVKLPPKEQEYLLLQAFKFDEVRTMSRVDADFPGTNKATWVAPNPDSRFDSLNGLERLNELEQALATGRRRWDDDPAERAADWINQPSKTDLVLADLEIAPNAGEEYPKIWERFGWADTPSHAQIGEQQQTGASLLEKAQRVLILLKVLPEPTARASIAGITHWLSNWEKYLITLPELFDVWLRLWPIAVEAINCEAGNESQIEPDLLNLSVVSNDNEPKDLDTLNAPVGKLVGVLLASLPSVTTGDRPFEVNQSLKKIRDVAIAASGRSGLIVKHRMIEALPWFILADPEWTKEQLIAPLLKNTAEAISLWRAVARRTHFGQILKYIGPAMTERATDLRLSRDTRKSLVWTVTLEILHAYRENRPALISSMAVQQMLRSIEDEVRAHAAETLQRFISHLSAQTKQEPAPPTAEFLFRQATRPFLEQVWPQERSLATPGVSRAFADLPIVCGDDFAQAVNTIEPFLVPFDCWSMLDYGLYGEDDSNVPKLSRISTIEKAEAFLRLLNHTIGTAEGSIVPMDLGNALEQIRNVAPKLAETPIFRRLASLTRR